MRYEKSVNWPLSISRFARRSKRSESDETRMYPTSIDGKPFHFWARGYCVSTVGLDEEMVRAYIRNQEAEEKRQEDLGL